MKEEESRYVPGVDGPLEGCKSESAQMKLLIGHSAKIYAITAASGVNFTRKNRFAVR